jgi:hypothetical protein
MPGKLPALILATLFVVLGSIILLRLVDWSFRAREVREPKPAEVISQGRDPELQQVFLVHGTQEERKVVETRRQSELKRQQDEDKQLGTADLKLPQEDHRAAETREQSEQAVRASAKQQEMSFTQPQDRRKRARTAGHSHHGRGSRKLVAHGQANGTLAAFRPCIDPIRISARACLANVAHGR